MKSVRLLKTLIIIIKYGKKAKNCLWCIIPTVYLLRSEDLAQIVPDDARCLSGVDRMPDALLLVVFDNRAGLLVEDTKTLRKSLDVVVRALDEWLAGDVVGHGLLGWANEPTSASFNDW